MISKYLYVPALKYQSIICYFRYLFPVFTNVPVFMMYDKKNPVKYWHFNYDRYYYLYYYASIDYGSVILPSYRNQCIRLQYNEYFQKISLSKPGQGVILLYNISFSLHL